MLVDIFVVPLPLAADGGGWSPIFHFFWESGPVGKIVLGVLLLFSIASWTIMIGKWMHFRRVEGQNNRFLAVFRRSSRFSEINSAAGSYPASPLVGMFQAGYLELDSQVKAGATEQETMVAAPKYRIRSLGGIERSLRRAMTVELQLLGRNTWILATTATATPFIGLFGTVWGIMIAFNDIGTTGTASIVAVAPGIAEALINTSMGLLAAIPALVGFNQFSARLRQMRAQMEDFTLEFINLAERNFT
ncbi:MAG TPA: MotA/TolQ/ExbB proton channel family protein [Thermoanaerobaculia bacterium]|nr:MotA/TolQ/ExbB proton channel family protein [Thermoanaerobaculia bacterium]